jgi:peptidoglycan L-alanyl-D-glutamate endopeptidase CwlK
MSFELDPKSVEKLIGVHPELVNVVKLAAQKSPLDFVITEGVRTLERQKQLVAAGASRTLKSRHLTGHAVDLAAKVGGEVRWDWPLYAKLAQAMKDAAIELKVSIQWGGDWKTLRDGPHFQLHPRFYP